MVDAIAHIHIKPPRLAKERFVLRRPTPVAMAGRFILGIRLRFHNHAPQQTSIALAFHQPATHKLRSYQLGRTAEKGSGESWKIFSDGLGPESLAE